MAINNGNNYKRLKTSSHSSPAPDAKRLKTSSHSSPAPEKRRKYAESIHDTLNSDSGDDENYKSAVEDNDHEEQLPLSKVMKGNMPAVHPLEEPKRSRTACIKPKPSANNTRDIGRDKGSVAAGKFSSGAGRPSSHHHHNKDARKEDSHSMGPPPRRQDKVPKKSTHKGAGQPPLSKGLLASTLHTKASRLEAGLSVKPAGPSLNHVKTEGEDPALYHLVMTGASNSRPQSTAGGSSSRRYLIINSDEFGEEEEPDSPMIESDGFLLYAEREWELYLKSLKKKLYAEDIPEPRWLPGSIILKCPVPREFTRKETRRMFQLPEGFSVMESTNPDEELEEGQLMMSWTSLLYGPRVPWSDALVTLLTDVWKVTPMQLHASFWIVMQHIQLIEEHFSDRSLSVNGLCSIFIMQKISSQDAYRACQGKIGRVTYRPLTQTPQC